MKKTLFRWGNPIPGRKPQRLYTTFCCDEFEECSGINVGNRDDSIFVIEARDDYGDIQSRDPITFCPFCGERIVIAEEKKKE